jgi:L-amino acid N-acyltransferase YncA
MIRPATPADAPALAALWNPWITDTAFTFASLPKSAQDVAQMIATRPAFFTTDTVQGFATYSQFRSGNGYATCMEHTVILSPQAHGNGLGRALMQAVESHARQNGAHQMIAGISAENPTAITFHSKLGYHHTATIPQAGYKFGRFIDLVLMQKFL